MGNRKHFAKRNGRAVLVGQNWDDNHGTARVMAVAEGYAMMRRKGVVPFAVAIKALDENWRIASPEVF